MKIYRLDCSSNFRLVFQLRNHKVFTRIREWYKHKRRINGITKSDYYIIIMALEQYKECQEKKEKEEKLNMNSLASSLRDNINNILYKLR